MTVLYLVPCYNEACYKGTALYMSWYIPQAVQFLLQSLRLWDHQVLLNHLGMVKGLQNCSVTTLQEIRFTQDRQESTNVGQKWQSNGNKKNTVSSNLETANSVFDCHLSPVGPQMAVENSVSNDFWSIFVDSINVFDCRMGPLDLRSNSLPTALQAPFNACSVIKIKLTHVHFLQINSSCNAPVNSNCLTTSVKWWKTV